MSENTGTLEPPSRWRLMTPTRLLLMLVIGEVLMVLSDRFDWLFINERKGWTSLLCLAFVSAAVAMLALRAAIKLLFRKRMQFSLSTILTFVAVLAIPCSWLAAELRAAKRQREAIAACWEQGCSYFYDNSVAGPGQLEMRSGTQAVPLLYQYLGEDFFHDIAGGWPQTDAHLELLREQTAIHTLLANNSQITDAGLETLTAFRGLRWLELRDSPQVTDAGMRHLHGLTKLETLMLRRTKVSDDGMIHLRDKKQLQMLDLGMTKVTGKGLRHITASTQLRELHFWGNAIDDASLNAIQEMTQLKKLDLGGAPITDAGLKHLRRLSELEQLGLRGAEVSDEGLREIASHTLLRELDLFNTQVSDAGVEHLTKLVHLEIVYIGETKITVSGIAKLKAALPNCEIR